MKSNNVYREVIVPGQHRDLKVVSSNSLTRRSQLKNLLNELQSPFPIHKNYELAPFVHWKGNSTSSIHRWLRYAEAYSPELNDKPNLEGRILDPFCGCGSIMVGAAQRGLALAGVDINPLSTFSTKVKLTKLNHSEINQLKTIHKDLKTIIRKPSV